MRSLGRFVRRRGVSTTISALLALAAFLLAEAKFWDSPYVSGSLHAAAVVCAVGALICWAAIPPDGAAGIRVIDSPDAVIERNTSPQEAPEGIDVVNSPGAKVVQNSTDADADADGSTSDQAGGG